MKHIKLFENDNSTQSNTNGMGAVRSPQPSQIPGQVNQLPSQQTPVSPVEEKKNEIKIIRFNDFLLEDGGVAAASMSGSNGMGAVSAPIVGAVLVLSL